MVCRAGKVELKERIDHAEESSEAENCPPALA